MEKVIVNVCWLNNYSAASDEVLGCVACGNTFNNLKQNYISALEYHLEGMREDGDEIPTKLQGEYELEFVLNTSALLHSLDGILTRKAIAKVTGINESQLTHYANGYRNPRPQQRIRIVEGIKKIGRELVNI